MKKRIKAKKNKQLIYNKIFNPLIKNELKIECIKFRNGYYIFNFGKNKVSSFKIKGIPDILFCVWNLNDGLKIFGDVIGYIDKFKPSHSTLNFDNVNELISFANKIKNSYNESLSNILKEKFIDDEKKNEPTELIISDYKSMVSRKFELEHNNGLTKKEVNTCKENDINFIEYCKSINIPRIYKIEPIIFYKVYSIYHVLVDEKNQSNDDFMKKVSELNRNHFFINLYSSKDKINDVKKRILKNKNNKIIRII